MQIARFAIVLLFAFATYLGGAKLAESMQRRQVLRRSAELQMRLRGSRQPWAFESPDRRVHRADSAISTWRLLLMGADDCVSCVRQQSALLETLSQSDTSLLSQIEVWLISDQFVAWGDARKPLAQLRVRNFRYSPQGPVQFTVGSLRPLVVLVDPRGVVQRLRVGFLPGDEFELVEEVKAQVLAAPLRSRNY